MIKLRLNRLLTFWGLGGVIFGWMAVGTVLARGQPSASTVSLTLSSPAVAAGTVVTVQASVTDANGAVPGGLIDFFDDAQLAATIQVVKTSGSGFAVGTATLRRLFGPGTHNLTAKYRGTTRDNATSSPVAVLTVSGNTVNSSTLPQYAGTRDLADGPVYGIISGIAVADFNGDGILDVAATEFDEPTVVAVCMGDPAHPGQFLAPAFLHVQADEIDRITAVDYDADGLVDLMVTDTDSGLQDFFRNDPAHPGTFLAPIYQSLPANFAMADFDHDGLPDLVGAGIVNGKNNLFVYLNNPANPGRFLYTSRVPLSLTTVRDVQTADLNGDGRPDVVVSGVDANFNGFTLVMLADPANAGEFLPPVTYTGWYGMLCLVDLNEDGLPDMIEQNYSSILYGGATSGFFISMNDPLHPGTFLPPTAYSGALPVTFAVGDVDGDHKVDLVAGYGDNTIRIFRGNGDGSLAAPSALMTGPTAPAWENSAIALADLDGDGLTDMVTASLRQNALQVFLHEVPGTPLIRTSTDLSRNGNYVFLSNQTLVLTATEGATSGLQSGTVEFYDTFGGGTSTSIGTAPIVNGVAVLSETNLKLGFHDFNAVFHGDNVYAPSESLSTGIFVNQGGASSMTTLNAAPNPAIVGQTITLQATSALSGTGSGTPTGSTQFFDGTTLLGTAPLVGGTASFAVSSLTPGIHLLTAVYSGDTAFSGSTSPVVSELVQGAASMVALSSSTNPAQYGTTVTLSAAITSSAQGVSGSVNFLDGSTTLGNVQVSAAGGATLSVSTLSPGTHLLTAVYAGDAMHNPATSNLLVEVIGGAPSSVTLVAMPMNAVSFQTITLQASVASSSAPNGIQFSGTVTFLANGIALGNAPANASGSATLSTSALGAGSYTFTASYGGNTGFAASVSNAVIEKVSPDATMTVLQVAPNPVGQQQAATYSGKVTPVTSVQSANGTVRLMDGGTLIGSGVVDGQGNFSGSLTGLAPGMHQLTAVYGGSANFLGSASASAALVVLTEDFDVLTDTASLAIRTEHHAPLTVSLQGLGGLQDTVDLSCAGLPAHATCTFASAQLPVGLASTGTLLMIDTDDVLYYANATTDRKRPGPILAWLALGGLALGGLFGQKRRWPGLLVWMLVGSTMLLVSGCSGKYPAHTAPGTYDITVQAKAERTGIAHAANVTLQVLP